MTFELRNQKRKIVKAGRAVNLQAYYLHIMSQRVHFNKSLKTTEQLSILNPYLKKYQLQPG